MLLLTTVEAISLVTTFTPLSIETRGKEGRIGTEEVSRAGGSEGRGRDRKAALHEFISSDKALKASNLKLIDAECRPKVHRRNTGTMVSIRFAANKQRSLKAQKKSKNEKKHRKME